MVQGGSHSVFLPRRIANCKILWIWMYHIEGMKIANHNGIYNQGACPGCILKRGTFSNSRICTKMHWKYSSRRTDRNGGGLPLMLLLLVVVCSCFPIQITAQNTNGQHDLDSSGTQVGSATQGICSPCPSRCLCEPQDRKTECAVQCSELLEIPAPSDLPASESITHL